MNETKLAPKDDPTNPAYHTQYKQYSNEYGTASFFIQNINFDASTAPYFVALAVIFVAAVGVLIFGKRRVSK